MARFSDGGGFDPTALERRNAKTLDSLDPDLGRASLELGRELCAYFDHHDGKPAPTGWGDVEPIEVGVPQAPKRQLNELVASGEVGTIAYDPALVAAFGPAREAGLRYAEERIDATAPRIWREARKEFGEAIERLRDQGHAAPETAGHPIHHLVFPKSEHPQHVLNPEMLILCPPDAMPGTGDGETAHEQFHEVYGVEGDNKRKMAWGDIGDPGVQQIMRDNAFRNPKDRAPYLEIENADRATSYDPLGRVGELVRKAEEEFAGQLGYLEKHFERAIALDTETTGLSPTKGDRIVEIAGVELLDGVASGRTFHAYLDPEREIPARASQIHGIDNGTVAGMPTFAEKAQDLREFIGESALIAHNAPFDMRFLNAGFAAAGLSEVETMRVTDTLAMARKLHPGEKNSLDALCERHDVHNRRGDRGGGHGALTDAKILADLYLKLVTARQVGEEEA